MRFLPWEIRVAFPRQSQLRQSRAVQPTVHAGCFSVSIIHRTLTWTMGSLTCLMLFFFFCLRVHTGPRVIVSFGLFCGVCSLHRMSTSGKLTHSRRAKLSTEQPVTHPYGGSARASLTTAFERANALAVSYQLIMMMMMMIMRMIMMIVSL